MLEAEEENESSKKVNQKERTRRGRGPERKDDERERERNGKETIASESRWKKGDREREVGEMDRPSDQPYHPLTFPAALRLMLSSSSRCGMSGLEMSKTLISSSHVCQSRLNTAWCFCTPCSCISEILRGWVASGGGKACQFGEGGIGYWVGGVVEEGKRQGGGGGGGGGAIGDHAQI